MTDKFMKDIHEVMLEYLTALNELSPLETEITKDGHAAQARLTTMIEELDRDFAILRALVSPMSAQGVEKVEVAGGTCKRT